MPDNAGQSWQCSAPNVPKQPQDRSNGGESAPQSGLIRGTCTQTGAYRDIVIVGYEVVDVDVCPFGRDHRRCVEYQAGQCRSSVSSE